MLISCMIFFFVRFFYGFFWLEIFTHAENLLRPLGSPITRVERSSDTQSRHADFEFFKRILFWKGILV